MTVSDSIPSTAVFGWQALVRQVIQVRVGIEGMTDYEPSLGPSAQGLDVAAKFPGCLMFRQHAALAKPIVARAKSVALNDKADSQGIEDAVATPSPCRATREKRSIR
jgi:hypothetical protein